MKGKVTVEVIEAAALRTRSVETFSMKIRPSNEATLAAAIAEVARRGYKVIHNQQGGTCIFVPAPGGRGDVIVTVHPGQR